MSFPYSRIAVVGVGSVGSAICAALFFQNVAVEIVLVDVDAKLRHAQWLDLSDAAFLSRTQVSEGSMKDAGQCSVVVVTAGAKPGPDEKRTALLRRNKAILKSVLAEMAPFAGGTILLLVADPIDVLTGYAQEISGLPRNRVVGSGTFLGTARLRRFLADKTELAPSSMYAYVVGEHGDRQMVAWCPVTIAGEPMASTLPMTDAEREDVEARLRDRAHDIIAVKGATAFGIGAMVTSLCESFVFGRRAVRTVSHWQDEWNCCLSMPAIIGRTGVEATVEMRPSEAERGRLARSADVIQALVRQTE